MFGADFWKLGIQISVKAAWCRASKAVRRGARAAAADEIIDEISEAGGERGAGNDQAAIEYKPLTVQADRHIMFIAMTRNKHFAVTHNFTVHYQAVPDGGYVAFVPALPGCHTQGDTLEETRKNVKEAIELYLESLAAHKEAIPRETGSFLGTITVAVPAGA